jgi:H+/Cl- antiporter ClcA
MAFPRKLNQLCTPAFVYFVLSVVGIIVTIFQNMGNTNKYCLGGLTCNVPSTIIIFIMKIICVLFWTWVLNLMCNDGHKNIAWFLVLLPFILIFLAVGMVSMNQKKKQKEGMTSSPCASGTCPSKKPHPKP